VEGEEVKYPVLNSREWHAMSVKDKLISIILNAGHTLDEIEMERIEEILAQYDKPLEPPK
jgi:S-adenosylhomocysteine hydrolase